MKTKIVDQDEKVALAIVSCSHLWGNDLRDIEQLQTYMDSVVKTRWFQDRFWDIASVEIHEEAPGEDMAWTTGDDVWHVAPDRPYWHEMFMLYILARISGGDDHGRYFCHDFLLLLSRFANPHVVRALREMFSSLRVVHRLPPTPKEEYDSVGRLIEEGAPI